MQAQPETTIGKLRFEAASCGGWLGALGNLLTLQLIERSYTYEQKRFPHSALRELLQSLLEEFKPPYGYVLDESGGALVEHVDNPFGPGRVVKVDVATLALVTSEYCDQLAFDLRAGRVQLKQGVVVELRQ